MTMKAINEANYSHTVFNVAGDSMDNGMKDGFTDGNTLLVRTVNLNEFRDSIQDDLNSFWVIEVGSDTYFKQISEYNKSKNVIKCHSLNSSYDDFFIEVENISKVHRVIRVKQEVWYCEL